VLRYGMCGELSPEVFSLDEHGFVVAHLTEIPNKLMPATEDAVNSCPEKVLKLTRSYHAPPA
jgi:ferredoxin